MRLTLLFGFAPIALSACPTEDFSISVDPGSGTGDFFDVVVVDVGVGSASFDTGADGVSGAGYYDFVRPALAGCVACHGGSGPVAPALNSYAAVRNSVEDVRRAILAGHDGDYAALDSSCNGPSGVDPALADALSAWADAGFPTGQPSPPPEVPALPAADFTLSFAPAASDTPRCYAIGEVPSALERVRIGAEGLAWVELYAVAPAFDALMAARDQDDGAPGWDCDATLGLVPQPLVAFWHLGGTPEDYGAAPLVTPAGSQLIARVGRAPLTAESTAATVELWLGHVDASATVFVPLHLYAASVELPWDATATARTIHTQPEVDRVRRHRAFAQIACLQARDCVAGGSVGPCEADPIWPASSVVASDADLTADDGLEVACHGDGPCDMQLGVSGPFAAIACNDTARDCASACAAGDLACLQGCAGTSDASNRCQLCVLASQLACREATCPSAVASAWAAVDACANDDDYTSCTSEDALAPLSACATSPLCDAALTACGLDPL